MFSLPTEILGSSSLDERASGFDSYLRNNRRTWAPLSIAVERLLTHCRKADSRVSRPVYRCILRRMDWDRIAELESRNGHWFPSLELELRTDTGTFATTLLKRAVEQQGTEWIGNTVPAATGRWKTCAPARKSGLWLNRVEFQTIGRRTVFGVESAWSKHGTIGLDAVNLFGLQLPALSEALVETGAALFAEGVRLPGGFVPYLAGGSTDSSASLFVLHEDEMLPSNAVGPYVTDRVLVAELPVTW